MKIFASLDVPVPPNPAAGLVGRQVANASFLEALLRESDFDAFHFFPGDAYEHRQFELALSQTVLPRLSGLDLERRIQLYPRFTLPGRLQTERYHVFHQSDPLTFFAPLTHLRSRFALEPFPVTSPIHSISYPSYMETWLRLLLPGPEGWDAIVCTSRAGQQVLERAFEHAAQIPPLDRLALRRKLQLRRIPLGVEADQFQPATAAQKQAARHALGLPLDQTLGLCLGRFSEYDKYDLVPLLQAFQRVLREQEQRPVLRQAGLVLAGARQGSNYPERLMDMAQRMGLAERVRLMLDVSSAQQVQLYQAADFFISPSDNIQETFGLTVLEALASGLPVLASDWDGYKDMVEHEVNGLLVPTHAGGDELLGELGLLSFQRPWHLAVAQGTVLEHGALSSHLLRLLTEPELRQKLGEAARQTALGKTWKHVVKQYLTLWDELKAEALRQPPSRPGPDPFSPPPSQLFAGHATGPLSPETLLELTERGVALLRQPEARPWYSELEGLFDATILRHLCAGVRMGMRMQAVVREVAAQYGWPEAPVTYQLYWLLKHDYVRIQREAGSR